MQDIIDILFQQIISFHSFSYRTLAEAKRELHIGDLVYCFDALSLCVYHHNLSDKDFGNLGRQLSDYYEAHKSNDEQKQRRETATLFHYLIDASCPYSAYEIKKALHPDFVLCGKKTIGVEVVELTTEYDKVLQRISAQNFGKGKTIKEIQKDALVVHGAKAKDYTYEAIDGAVAVGTGLIDVTQTKHHFSEQINGKRRKYEGLIDNFDTFIILCNAQHRIEITSEYDAAEIIQYASEMYASTKEVTVVILWEQNQHTEISQFQL